MGRFDAVPVAVPIGPCECPGAPHEQDEVYLRPRLGYAAGADASVAAAAYVGKAIDANDLAKAIVPIYIRGGAVGWNLVDDDGEAVPFDAEVLLSDWDVAVIVGDQADNLYSEVITRPLVKAASQSSPLTPTAASTSRRKRSTGSPRKRSKPSSTSTTRTDGIVTISPSPESDSKSSPNSVTAA